MFGAMAAGNRSVIYLCIHCRDFDTLTFFKPSNRYIKYVPFRLALNGSCAPRTRKREEPKIGFWLT